MMLWGIPVQVNPSLPDGLVLLTDLNPITGRRTVVTTIITACSAGERICNEMKDTEPDS